MFSRSSSGISHRDFTHFISKNSSKSFPISLLVNDSVTASKTPVGMAGGTLEGIFGRTAGESTEGFLEGFAEELLILEEFSEALFGKTPTKYFMKELLPGFLEDFSVYLLREYLVKLVEQLIEEV